MAQVSTIMILGALSMTSFGVSVSLPQTPGLDWKDIAGGGSAVLMFAALLVFLRYLADERKAQALERKEAAEERIKITETFGETATGLTVQFRDDVARGREEMHDLIRDIRAHHKPPPSPSP